MFARAIERSDSGVVLSGASLGGNFIMQVVDIQAFSVMFAARSILDSWSRIYRGILSLLREIL